MKVLTALLITVCIFGVIEASFLARTVKDAVELGASNEAQAAPFTSTVLQLDDAAALRANLINLGEEIIGTPTTSAAATLDLTNGGDDFVPKAAPLVDIKPSMVETDSFAQLLSQAEAEEAKLVKSQEQEILADRAETSEVLKQFETLDHNVEAFEKVLDNEKINANEVPDFHQSFADIAAEAEEDKLPVRTVSEIEAEVEAEMVQEASARLAAEAAKSLAEVEAETKAKADAEAETEAETETETETKTETEAETETETETQAEAETETEGEAETEAEGEAEAEEVSFAELGVLLTEQDSSLESYLAKVDSPAPEQEILEPTFMEEDEAIEAESGQDSSMLSFLLTNEELTAELDHVAKQMQQQHQ